MKNETSDGSKNPKPKILGATPLQISEDDAARLVGSIVEKGFSDNKQARPLGPTTAPRPTVLPFPVARHRSHGPHWGPKVGNFKIINDNGDADEDVGEGEDCDGMELAAGVANPVERKEKKGIDFSQWKEIVKNDSNSVLYEKKKEMHLNALEVGHKTQERKSGNLNRETAGPDNAKLHGTSCVDNAKEHFMTKYDKASSVSKELKEKTLGMSEMASDKEFHSFEHVKNENIVQPGQWPQSDINRSEDITLVEKEPMQNESSKEKRVDLKMQHMHKLHVASGFAAQNVVGGEGSLESQIDAENHARLAKMSADEIAEAQAEIMAKLNPELINALKKRGQAKVKRQKCTLSEIAGGEADDMQREKNLSELTANSYNSISDKPVEKVPQDTPKDEGDKSFLNTSPQNCGLWDAWSKRVERVRNMRFFLDGNIIGSDFAHLSDNGEASSASGYNADNVAERDFLRTEGDPGAAGYTIKEAVALTRSVVPGQRTFALNLIAAILDRAICSICRKQVGSASNGTDAEGSVDWEAIWAFTLGPEPELALSLRMSLDDNHNSVVLACAKAIQSVLSCDMNDIVFDILEAPKYARDVHTAPVFRSKQDVNSGFLRGGFWKYNTKPSNILCFPEESVGDTAEGEHTIQDDIVVAGQDFAAGLVRMGILPRICYLLETDPAAPLEECLISILIAISRHSPTCAAAVMDCGRLVQTVARRFASKEQMEINSCKIKSVMLLKALAQVEKKNCLTFIKNGIFRQVTWHLYRHPFSLDQWVKSGREACRLSSALLVEQLRIWKVFIHYGYCISDFSDLFTSLCIWLGVPTMDKLVNYDVVNEYCAITREMYLLLDVLAGRLPNFYSSMHERLDDTAQDKATWLWSHFGSIIDLAVEWIDMKSIPHVSRLFECQNKDSKYRSLQDSEINSLLWVISSVLNMLSSVLKAVIKEDTMSAPNDHLPWLPDFVPKIGLEIIKNGYLRVSGVSDTICNNNLWGNGSIVEYLCHLRIEKGQELAISSTCCLQGLFQVVAFVDELIQQADLEIHNAPSKFQSLPREDKVLANGILKSCAAEVQYLLTTLMKLITNEWQYMQPVEMFGRGGPAPGVGVGWGAKGGGYWSSNALLAQEDARLLIHLLEISEIPFAEDPLEAGGMGHRLNCCLAACLIVGPGNSPVIDKLLRVIFHVPVLKYLNFGIHQFLCHKGYKPFGWQYEDGEYLLFADVLAAHFRNRWLTVKKKQKAIGEINSVSHKPVKQNGRSLETIHEDMDEPNTADEESSSLTLEWAYQRLPLPVHWFLSSISTIYCEKNVSRPGASNKKTYMEVPSNFLDVANGGLFFLLGIEAITSVLGSEFCSPVKCVPVVWKLHAMSVILLSGMGILENGKSRDVYETLQNVYGETLDGREVVNLHGNLSVESLQFESEIHENYSTFIETLVEQFAAESYGDILFGRQVAIYLHRSVEASVRLSTWNALSNARALELLPPLAECCIQAKGYLKPIEDDERILDAYVKSWVSGALDKAAKRSSMAFSLVLHHLSSFIFSNVAGDMLALRSKLAKSLLRDYSRKQQHEGMLVKLICYEKPNMSLQTWSQVEKRLQLLKEICEGYMTAVQKLESCITTYVDSKSRNL
ncbi:transcriptional elongation regulator MINIYO isoform X2 [Sesamum indicum]|uniref:Transcriptional elongation regulator MINIYO isoform X2 n=1 Tax=Sesamum indicum TaxID=4182 RepID=A0A6I9TXR5_SESIN|nr:transcriptional elongation regulator MINIYO isoform X2 [Sesamum indicum]